MMLSSIVLGIWLQPCLADNDQTDLTRSLNSMIAVKQGEVYGGGKGVLLRNINDGLDASKKVVPGSFLTNDIVAASIAYPSGNPMCPNNGWTGYNQQGACSDDVWGNPIVLAVVGSKMGALFNNFDSIQDSTWGWGVFYGSDANSADQRCLYIDQNKGWNCPSYWIDQNGQSSWDPTKTGAGGFDWGNPGSQGGGGGGAGCHFNPGGHAIDQWDSSGTNLVEDSNCQCNYDLKGNGWQDWVEEWINHGVAKSKFSWMKWFQSKDQKAPSWALDLAACWVDNPRDMIYIQNMLWFKRFDWSNQLIPQTAWDLKDLATQRYYWGWNEVPVDRTKVNDANSWDALVIKLPAAICPGGTGGSDSVQCVDGSAQINLEDQLAWYENANLLKPGFGNINNKPGSQIVFLREWQQSQNHWQRWFYCESFNYERYKVVFSAAGAKNNLNSGTCYVDRGNGPAPKPSPPPTPPPPPPAPPSPPCTGTAGLFRLQKDSSKCMDISGGKLFNGARIQIWGCNGQDQQNWKWCSDGRIVSAMNDKKCLDIPGGDPSKPGALQMWDCNGQAGQYWKYDQNSMGVYPAQTGETMCLDAAGDSADQGTRVVTYSCHAGTGTGWLLGSGPAPSPPSPPPAPPAPPVGPCQGTAGKFMLNKDDSKCLDVIGGNANNGAGLQIWGCNGRANQNWKWCSDGRIVSELNENMCLDVPGGDFSKTQRLQMWNCNQDQGQYWKYDSTSMSIYPAKIGEKMCMDVENNSQSPGARVNLYNCHPGTGEAWKTGSALSNFSVDFVTV
jgi:hypothetical protein